MGDWIWSAVAAAIALVVAGGITWWLAKGCVVTRIGAVGAILGGLGVLGILVVLLDPDTAMPATAFVTAVAGTWMLAWALAGGIRGHRQDASRAAAAELATSAPVAVDHTPARTRTLV